MINSGVYCILNSVNNKKYIGQSGDVYRRIGWHVKTLELGCNKNKHLQAAFNKYGKSAFILKPILICEKSDLTYYEQKCMNVFGREYNLAPAADSLLGYKHTLDARRNMSKAQKGLNKPPLSFVHREAISKALSGRVRQDISAGLRGKKRSEAACDAISRGKLGKKQPNVSKGMLGKPHPHKGRKGIPFSLTHCKNLSEVRKGGIPWNKGLRGIRYTHSLHFLEKHNRQKDVVVSKEVL